jgi:hypothetical protein
MIGTAEYLKISFTLFVRERIKSFLTKNLSVDIFLNLIDKSFFIDKEGAIKHYRSEINNPGARESKYYTDFVQDIKQAGVYKDYLFAAFFANDKTPSFVVNSKQKAENYLKQEFANVLYEVIKSSNEETDVLAVSEIKSKYPGLDTLPKVLCPDTNSRMNVDYFNDPEMSPTSNSTITSQKFLFSSAANGGLYGDPYDQALYHNKPNTTEGQLGHYGVLNTAYSNGLNMPAVGNKSAASYNGQAVVFDTMRNYLLRAGLEIKTGAELLGTTNIISGFTQKAGEFYYSKSKGSNVQGPPYWLPIFKKGPMSKDDIDLLSLPYVKISNKTVPVGDYWVAMGQWLASSQPAYNFQISPRPSDPLGYAIIPGNFVNLNSLDKYRLFYQGTPTLPGWEGVMFDRPNFDIQSWSSIDRSVHLEFFFKIDSLPKLNKELFDSSTAIPNWYQFLDNYETILSTKYLSFGEFLTTLQSLFELYRTQFQGETGVNLSWYKGKNKINFFSVMHEGHFWSQIKFRMGARIVVPVNNLEESINQPLIRASNGLPVDSAIENKTFIRNFIERVQETLYEYEEGSTSKQGKEVIAFPEKRRDSLALGETTIEIPTSLIQQAFTNIKSKGHVISYGIHYYGGLFAGAIDELIFAPNVESIFAKMSNNPDVKKFLENSVLANSSGISPVSPTYYSEMLSKASSELPFFNKTGAAWKRYVTSLESVDELLDYGLQQVIGSIE